MLFELANFLGSMIQIGVFCYVIIVYFTDRPFLKKALTSEKCRVLQGFAEFRVVLPSFADIKKI